MKRVVIDTNVLVSGVFWKGPPYSILKAWKYGVFSWLISPEILMEYRRVLKEISEAHPNIRPGPILELIGLNCEMISPKPFKNACRDPDDDKFLAAALTGGAHFVVSGDKALLEIGDYRGIRIVEPAVFLNNI
jgi:uncharacterized protein